MARLRFIVLLLTLTLSACGPSEEEISNTIKITCNIIGASENINAAVRIKEVNAAREKIGASPFLGTEADILDSTKFGLCEQLVGNDPEHESLLKEQRQQEAELIAEAERVAAEKRAKEEAERKIIEDKKIEARRAQMAVIDEAIAKCKEMGISKVAAEVGVFSGCSYQQKEENYHTFKLGSFTSSFSHIYQDFAPSLKLPARIQDKMNNTSANDGYAEDSYGIISISWRFSVESIYGGTTAKSVQINVEVD
jgi:hypothetical protein